MTTIDQREKAIAMALAVFLHEPNRPEEMLPAARKIIEVAEARLGRPLMDGEIDSLCLRLLEEKA